VTPHHGYNLSKNNFHNPSQPLPPSHARKICLVVAAMIFLATELQHIFHQSRMHYLTEAENNLSSFSEAEAVGGCRPFCMSILHRREAQSDYFHVCIV